MTKSRTVWFGWVTFAAVMLVVLGLLNVLEGLVALLQNQVAFIDGDSLVVVNLTGWGILMLAFGGLLLAAGIGLLARNTVARVAAIVIVALHMLIQVGSLGAYPVWSLLMITLSVVVLFALTVHWRRLAGARRCHGGDGGAGHPSGRPRAAPRVPARIPVRIPARTTRRRRWHPDELADLAEPPGGAPVRRAHGAGPASARRPGRTSAVPAGRARTSRGGRVRRPGRTRARTEASRPASRPPARRRRPASGEPAVRRHGRGDRPARRHGPLVRSTARRARRTDLGLRRDLTAPRGRNKAAKERWLPPWQPPSRVQLARAPRRR